MPIYPDLRALNSCRTPCGRGISREPPESKGVTSVEEMEVHMANTGKGRAQDRAKVAGGQDHEVRYEAKKEGVSKSQVKDTVREVGNSRKKVEAELDRKR